MGGWQRLIQGLFVIEGVDEGIYLQPLSQYPREAEFLLAMFTLLEVQDVIDDQGSVVVRSLDLVAQKKN